MQNAQSQNKTPENRKIIVDEIHVRWEKFSENELAALKGRDDLVTQVQSRYSLDKAQAQKTSMLC